MKQSGMKEFLRSAVPAVKKRDANPVCIVRSQLGENVQGGSDIILLLRNGTITVAMMECSKVSIT